MTNASQIKQIIQEIGKSRVLLKAADKNYTYNGRTPRETQKDYYSTRYSKFKILLLNQLREKCDAALLNKFIAEVEDQIDNLKNQKDTHRVAFVFTKSKGELSDEADQTHSDIVTIIDTQIRVLNKIVAQLENEVEFIDYALKKDYQSDTADLEDNEIAFSAPEKATFKLKKKDALMLLFLLEETNLIDFGDRLQKIKFIETNFNYTEMRQNHAEHGKTLPMKGTGKEFSNFVSNDEINSNNQTLKVLLEKLESTILDYKFQVRKYKS